MYLSPPRNSSCLVVCMPILHLSVNYINSLVKFSNVIIDRNFSEDDLYIAVIKTEQDFILSIRNNSLV